MPRSPQARHWCFTVNNPEELLSLDPLPKHVRYLVYQEEIGEEGTHHFQGYVEFDRPTRLKAVKEVVGDRAHCEPRKKSRDQARNYCMKPDTRVGGPYEHGTWHPDGQGNRSDIQGLKALIDTGASLGQIWDAHPLEFLRYQRGITAARLLKARPTERQVTVIYCYGAPGTGKSRWAMDNHAGAFWKPKNKWWDGYESESTVVLDDWDQSWFQWRYLLRLLDRYPLLLEVKGGTIPALWTKIIITSNRPPWRTYNRWNPNIQMEALFRRISYYLIFQSPDQPPQKLDTVQAFYEDLEGRSWEDYLTERPPPSDPSGLTTYPDPDNNNDY